MRPVSAFCPLIPALAATPWASAFIRLDPPPSPPPTVLAWQHDDARPTVTPPANLALAVRPIEPRSAVPLLTFEPAPSNRLGAVARLVYHPTTAIPAAALFTTLDQASHPTSSAVSSLYSSSSFSSPLSAITKP